MALKVYFQSPKIEFSKFRPPLDFLTKISLHFHKMEKSLQKTLFLLYQTKTKKNKPEKSFNNLVFSTEITLFFTI